MRAIILGSGSKGNSTLLIGKTKKILIDVGFSYSKIVQDLAKYDFKPSDIDAILVTHTHKDHIAGLPVFVKKNTVSIYTNEIMSSELLKIVSSDNIMVVDDLFQIGEFNIETLHTSHDAKGSVGFIINCDGSSIVYVTDTGYINEKYLKRMVNKNVYILESNHDISMLMTGPYPYILKQRVLSDKGHLSNAIAGEYLNKIIGNKTKRVILAHLSEINNTKELAIETVSTIISNKMVIETASQDDSLDVGEF